MAKNSRPDRSGDPIRWLALHPECDYPNGKLTKEQQFALHEFLHTVVAAGYKLYQIVPIDLAREIIRAKLDMAQNSRQDWSGDPIRWLALHPECDYPDGKPTKEQQFSLHEFLHTVLAAGYKLYQIVPTALAREIVRTKLDMACKG
jgi:hypothetical protein